MGAQEAWAQGVFEVASSPAAVAAAREAGFEPEDGELFLSRKVPASGRSRSMLSGRSVPRSVLASVAAELVTIHGQADQLRIATTSRQREFLDRYAGDEVALAAYGKSWSALRAMDERLERLNSQESSMRQQADYLRESIERINRVDPQPGEMDELRARRDRIENAAEIAEGVTRALGALDASQVVDDVESSSAADLIDHASQALRAIHVEGVFSELATGSTPSAPICPTWCSACREKWTTKRVWRIWTHQRAHPRAGRADPPMGAGIVRRDRMARQGRIRSGGSGRLPGKGRTAGSQTGAVA